MTVLLKVVTDCNDPHGCTSGFEENKELKEALIIANNLGVFSFIFNKEDMSLEGESDDNDTRIFIEL